MWIFNSVKDYREMVDKIARSVFVISTTLLFLLSQACSEFMQALEKMSFGATIEIFNLKLNLAIFYIPLFMGIFEHMFKLHDIWSSIFGIRKRYDRDVIVKEFLLFFGIEKDTKKLSDKQIKQIMGDCFYRYASSTNPCIDSHYVTLALTEWCWFWIILDTIILYDIIGIVWLIISWWSWKNFFLFIGIEMLLITILVLVNIMTKKYTKKEIGAILSIKNNQTSENQKMKEIIEKAIKNALSNR